MPEQGSKPDYALFLGVISFVAAFFIPLLQANGVDLNWQSSIAAYVCIAVTCVWSFLRHASPHRTFITRLVGSITIFLVICLVAVYAVRQQVAREKSQELDSVMVVRVLSARSRQEIAGRPYVMEIEIQNSSQRDIPISIACGVYKVPLPVSAVVHSVEEIRAETTWEDRIFDEVAAFSKTAQEFQTLQADRTAHSYCASNWILDQNELILLKSKRIRLYVAGRIFVATRVRSRVGYVDYCETGNSDIGMANCDGHNLTHVETVNVK
jgi:hypothetical protein